MSKTYRSLRLQHSNIPKVNSYQTVDMIKNLVLKEAEFQQVLNNPSLKTEKNGDLDGPNLATLGLHSYMNEKRPHSISTVRP